MQVMSAQANKTADSIDPQHVLISYGSLRPGEVNYHIVENIEGEWINGTIKGELSPWRQYLRLIVDSNVKDDVPVGVLISKHLPEHWQRLDEFEGSAYQRILHDVETERGTLRGYVYVKPHEVPR